MWLGCRGEAKGMPTEHVLTHPAVLLPPFQTPPSQSFQGYGGGSPLATGTLSSSSCSTMLLDTLPDQGVLELPGKGA